MNLQINSKGIVHYNHLDWEIEQSLNNPTNKQILTCLNAGASALLLKNIPTQRFRNYFRKCIISTHSN